MTKTEILNRIENSEKSTKEALTVLEMGMRQMSDRNTQMLALSLNLISASIVETMSTLSLIMSEMMAEPTPEPTPEKAPESVSRGSHYGACTANQPDCLCVTCSRDNYDGSGADCCAKHPHKGCRVNLCADYVKEDPDA